MPPKSPYRFTGPQVEWLKRRLGSYMKAFDNEDSVNAIPHFVDKTCTDLRKEFKTADKDTKAIRQVCNPEPTLLKYYLFDQRSP